MWSCCGIENAVCCSDGEHCCPGFAPNCDPAAGACTNAAKEGDDDFVSVPMSKKTEAIRNLPGAKEMKEQVFGKEGENGGSRKEYYAKL